MRKSLFLLLVLGWCFSLPASRLPMVVFRTQDGLPQNRISALAQDRLGRLWIGTQSGAARYDGVEFVTYTVRNGLAGNSILRLLSGPEGSVFVVTAQGIDRISERGTLDRTLTPSDPIRDACLSADGKNLLILTEREVLETADGAVTRPFPVRLPIGAKPQAIAALANAVLVVGDDFAWRFSRTGTTRMSLPSPGRFARAIGGRVIVGIAEGFVSIQGEGGFLAPLSPRLAAPATGGWDAVVDRQGRLVLATDDGILRREGSRWERIDEAMGLANNRVLSLLADREGNLFAGTEIGLVRITPYPFQQYVERDGLPSSQIWDFLEEADGSVLMACTGGVARFRDQRIVPAAINGALRNQSVRSILPLPSGHFLLGCRSGEVIEWDGDARWFLRHRGPGILHGVRDRRGTIWLATDAGLLETDGRTYFRRHWVGLIDPTIWDVAVLAPDQLLVGTQFGMQLFRDGQFVASPWQDQLGKVFVNQIRVVSPREIYVATESFGVVALVDGQRRTFDRSTGLLHDDVWSVLRDRAGVLWVNSTRALERVELGQVIHFNRDSGLIGDEGCIHASYQARDGRIFFGIMPGLVVCQPRSSWPAPAPPILALRQMTARDRRRVTPVDFSRPVVLNSRQRNVEFSYSGITLNPETPFHYRTRLVPFDEDWSAPGTVTTARYTHLPPGQYRFEVQTLGEGKVTRSRLDPPLEFIIAAPLWTRWWFQLAGGILAVLLLNRVTRIRVRRLERQKRQLEILVDARTAELADRNRELAQISVTDPLTQLKNRRYLDAKIEEDLHHLRRSLHPRGTHPGERGNADTMGVFMIDADFFKRVNDLFGHKAGDAVLKVIADRLTAQVRQSDTVVRWGGEEFLIVTREAEPLRLPALAEKLRLAVSATPIAIEPGVELNRTISIGFVSFPFLPGDMDQVSWNQALSLADSALYLAKSNGRNRCIGIAPGSVPWDRPGKYILDHLDESVAAGYLRIVTNGTGAISIPPPTQESPCSDPSACRN